MKIRVWDVEDNKERVIDEAHTELGEVGTVMRVRIKKGVGNYEVHHFKVLEIIEK